RLQATWSGFLLFKTFAGNASACLLSSTLGLSGNEASEGKGTLCDLFWLRQRSFYLQLQGNHHMSSIT
ncbi:MAG: hypothetical protein P8M70_06845, partial [Verrucomicrobiota bacterium]|nr:hypothetical protein [Verrucomicrobiota bacterium]